MAFMHEFESSQKGSRKRPGRRFFFSSAGASLAFFVHFFLFFLFLSIPGACTRNGAPQPPPKRKSALSALPGAPPAIKIHAPYGGQATSYRHERLRRTDTASGPHHHQIRSVPHPPARARRFSGRILSVFWRSYRCRRQSLPAVYRSSPQSC